MIISVDYLIVIRMKRFVCIKCGHQLEAINGSSVFCTRCGRKMWEEKDIRSSEIIREEMILNFENYLKAQD